jgi:hypothetical protein
MGYPLQCKIDYSDAEPRAFGYRPLSFCICGGAGPEECREHIAHMVVVAIDPHAYQRDGAGEGEQLDDFDDTGEDW